MQPAKNQLRMRMPELLRRGDYLVGMVVWDTDAAEDMAPANLVHNIKQFVKQRASEKEEIDLGFIGRVVMTMIDYDSGIAEVRFRSSESRVGPQTVVEGGPHEL